MHPIETIDCNFTYTAPAGVSSEQCGDLHCTRHAGTITSYWQPSDQERQHIASGGLVHFTVWGNQHPVVSLTAEPSTERGLQPACEPITPPSSAATSCASAPNFSPTASTT